MVVEVLLSISGYDIASSLEEFVCGGRGASFNQWLGHCVLKSLSVVVEVLLSICG